MYFCIISVYNVNNGLLYIHCISNKSVISAHFRKIVICHETEVLACPVIDLLFFPTSNFKWMLNFLLFQKSCWLTVGLKYMETNEVLEQQFKYFPCLLLYLVLAV